MILTNMSTKLIMRQSYRLYMAAVGVLAIWSLLGSTSVFSIDPVTLGYSWIALAVVGGVMGIGLYRKREKTFSGSKEERKRFERHSLSGAPLYLYGVAIAGWAVFFGGWYSGLVEVSTTLLGYGWLAIAAYGAVLTIGLVTKHSSAVAETVTPSSSENQSL